MHPDIKLILSQFSKADLSFMDYGCIFNRPAYRYIAKKDDNPIGFIEARAYNDELYLNIGIIPAMRGHGFAQMLFRAFLTWFHRTKYSAIRWNAHQDNIASIRLAQKLGFVQFNSPNQDPGIVYLALGR